jgi:serine/threonine-protein kinase HipA
MPFCPITLGEIEEGTNFSAAGLRSLDLRLKSLHPLDLSHEEQLRQARLRADKMSIQGVQPKLSAVLNVRAGRFEIVDTGGKFILKPNPPPFAQVPANEALTMTMAAAAGIEVPPHGLVPAVDGSWVYVIKRFDRIGRSGKVPVEDFAQLTGATRDTKYDSSLERVAKVVEDFCTFPAIEKANLARRALFCFLTGNEEMHLKNWSLITADGRIALAPAYDLLNTTVVLENAVEESALPLRSKRRKLTKSDWLDYFCRERLRLPPAVLDGILTDLAKAAPHWQKLIQHSRLSPNARDHYSSILGDRLHRLSLA